MKVYLFAAWTAFLSFVGCTNSSEPLSTQEVSLEQNAVAENLTPSVQTEGSKLLPGVDRISVIGDSLTEGYGVESSKSFPKVLEELLHENGRPDIQVQSSGSSGSTSASGPSRVAWALKSNPDLIILALGANDGLRGLDVSQMKENLRRTVQEAKKANVKVMLAGMKAPPNLGRSYTESYEKAFKEVAEAENVPLFPFLLEGVAGERSLNIADGIHPNEAGHRIMGQNLFKFLSGLEF